MNEGDSAPESDRNLSTLLISLRSGEDPSKKIAHFRSYNYCHDILTLSTIPSSLEFILWIFILLLYDIIQCMIAIPCPWYFELSPTTFINDPSSRNYIFSELLIQQLTFAAIMIMIVFILAHWFSISFYDPDMHLSKASASILHFSFFYLPIIMSPLCGLLFGTLVLATCENVLLKDTSIFYALALAVVYLLLVINRSVFVHNIQYNLLIGTNFFACISQPFDSVDLMFMFFISAFTPFRVGEYNQYITIECVINIARGIYFLFIQKKIPFISKLPNIIIYKIYVDAICFPIVTLIEIWVKMPVQFLLDLWVSVYLLDIWVGFMILHFYFNLTKKRYLPIGGHCFDPTKVSNESQALIMLQSGISFQIADCTNPDFLYYILMNYFGESIIPDIIRICVTIGIPMSDMPCQRFAMTPSLLGPMQFLAFQIHLYEMFLKTEGQEIENAKISLHREIEAIKHFIETFWTEADVEHHTIYQLGRILFRGLTLLRNTASKFAHSNDIAQMLINFSNDVLASPSKAIIPPPSPFWALESPTQNYLSFALVNKADLKQKAGKKKSKTSIERFISRYPLGVMRANKIIFLFFLICFLALVITYHISYTNNLQHFSKVYTDVGQLFTFSVALAYQMLKNTDKFTQLPSVSEISEILDISAQTATDFRTKIQLTSEEMTNLTQYLQLFDFQEYPFQNLTKCNPMSLSLVSSFEPSIQPSIEEHECMIMTIFIYIKYVADFADETLSEIYRELKVIFRTNIIELYIYVVSFSIFYILAAILLRRKYHKCLYVVRKIFATKPNRYEMKETKFPFSFMTSFIIWAVFVSISISLYFLLKSQTNKTSRIMRDNLAQMDVVSDIARNSLISLALIEFSLINTEESHNLTELAKSKALEIIDSVEILTSDGINESFMAIDPLNRWISSSDNSFSLLLLDYSQRLLGGNFTGDSYVFLQTRFDLLFNISVLANSTLDDMITAALFSIQGNSSSFWLICIAFIVIALFMWWIFEYIHDKRKTWFYGIKYIMRKEMNSSPQKMRTVHDMLEPKSKSILERLPYPAIVHQKDNVILSCNELAASYTKYSVEQLIGQQFIEHFPEGIQEDGKTLKFSSTQVTHGVLMTQIQDMTEMEDSKNKHQEFVQTIKIKLPELPIKSHIILISFKIKADQKRFEEIASLITDTESKIKGVTRITMTSTNYRAFVMDRHINILQFTEPIMKETLSEISCSLTEGEGVILSPSDFNIISTVCGNLVHRADEYLSKCTTGVLYIDSSLAASLNFDNISTKYFIL